MAILRAPLSARITSTLDLTEITLRLSHDKPPVLECRGKMVTKERGGTTGRFSDVQVTLRHLPPSVVAFIDDMKAALSAADQTKRIE